MLPLLYIYMSQNTCNFSSKIHITGASSKPTKVLAALVDLQEQLGRIECLIKSTIKLLIFSVVSTELSILLMILKELTAVQVMDLLIFY
jgi:hypothetical protein